MFNGKFVHLAVSPNASLFGYRLITSEQNETLRLFPSAPVIPKQVSRTASQVLTINNRPYHIPAGTNITLNPPGAHLSRTSWGPDVAAFDPSRWDPTNNSSFLQKFSTPDDLAEFNAPVVLQPKKGAFIPFSAGLRACLGKKFAQVEYCAVVAVLLRRYQLEFERCGSETREEAVRRVERIVRDSTNEMGLMMQERFGIVMTERKGQ